MYTLNVVNEGWIPQSDLRGHKLPALACHASAAVCTPELEKSSYNNIYSHPMRVVEIASNDGINVGYYIFGGLVSKNWLSKHKSS